MTPEREDLWVDLLAAAYDVHRAWRDSTDMAPVEKAHEDLEVVLRRVEARVDERLAEQRG